MLLVGCLNPLRGRNKHIKETLPHECEPRSGCQITLPYISEKDKCFELEDNLEIIKLKFLSF